MVRLKTELKADIAKLQTDIGGIKWIITGGVGLYLRPALHRGVAEVTRGPRGAAIAHERPLGATQVR